MKKQLTIIGLFVAVLCWGASFFSVKHATSQVGVWPFLLYRFGIASSTLVLLFPKKFFKAKASTIWKGGVLGVLLFLTIWTQTEGLQITTAGRSGFITSLYVPFTPLIAWLL